MKNQLGQSWLQWFLKPSLKRLDLMMYKQEADRCCASSAGGSVGGGEQALREGGFLCGEDAGGRGECVSVCRAAF